MRRLEEHFGEWVLKYRWPVIIVCLVLVFLAGTGMKNLAMSTDYRVFFSADNPQLQAFDALENTYTKNDNVMFVLTPKSGKVFSRDALEAVAALTKKAWQLPYSIRVDSIKNFQYTEAKDDDLIVRDLYKNAQQMTDAQLKEIQKIAQAEPLLAGRLISPDSKVTAVNATIQLPGKNEMTEVPKVVAAARKMADEIRSAYPQMEVRLTGMIMMNNAFSEASMGDMKSLVPLSFLLMMVFLAVLLRDFQRGWPALLAIAASLAGIGALVTMVSLPVPIVVILLLTGFALLLWSFPATMSTLLVILLSIIAAMGVGGHLGFPITPPSASAPTIILTVAIANSVHILITLLFEMHHGKDKRTAINESLRINLQPVFLTSVTTVIGFLSMNFSDVPPFRELGNFVAFGVVASSILSITFLPALMSLLPIKVRISKQEDKDALMIRLGDFVVRRRSQLLFGMTALVIVLVIFIPRNQLNDVFVHYFDKTVAFRINADYTTDHLTGTYTADYSLPSGESGGISNPAYLHEVDAFSNWWRKQPETMHVNTFTDIMKRLNKNMHGDDPAWYRLPERRELAAQYLLLYEMSLPYGLDLNNQISVDKSNTRLTISLKTLSSKEVLALDKRAHQWLQKNTHIIKNTLGSGPTLMFAHIGQRNIVSMLKGTTVALIMISMILIFALRSFKIGLVSMLPNLVPAAMGFGLWGLLVGEVGLALSIVTGMTLGIVVDDTVHFLSKYLRARREKGMSSEDAVRYAFTHVGRAMITTSVVLVVGFIVLAFSSFKLNSGMGLLTAMVIVFALMADLFLLPPLLMKLEGKKA
ncbi:Predicted exporter of the RND superfamily [hydrothermal vent metagenome]|uniref:Predicted exporter of the RND superfamily n=1 Tax=hydrothermal vent metagenome TaxID=652676 RepID=A0A3B1BQ05_9ZZZZ